MSHNFLEQLVAEWYEYKGYYVRRNVRVGKLRRGGYEGELDVVAFHPRGGPTRKGHLVHIEASMQAISWDARAKKFQTKFAVGKRYIPSLFAGLKLPEVEQIALLGVRSAGPRKLVGEARVQRLGELLKQIRADLKQRPVNTNAVPEQYVILRALQYASHYWNEQRGRERPERQVSTGRGGHNRGTKLVRHRCRVSGQTYDSVRMAFVDLGLNLSKHERFRFALKRSAKGAAVYEEGGRRYPFKLAERY